MRPTYNASQIAETARKRLQKPFKMPVVKASPAPPKTFQQCRPVTRQQTKTPQKALLLSTFDSPDPYDDYAIDADDPALLAILK